MSGSLIKQAGQRLELGPLAQGCRHPRQLILLTASSILRPFVSQLQKSLLHLLYLKIK